MIARWPGKIMAGTESSRIGAFWDFMPTFADVAKTDVPSDCTGTSFLPEMLGNASAPAEFLYWEFPAYGHQQAIRQGKWKAIRQSMRPVKVDEEWKIVERETELYDLEADRAEQNDVAAENPEIVKKLSKLMASARVPSELFAFPALDRPGAERVKSETP